MASKNKSTYAWLLTLIFIAFYFSSTLFYHTHQIDGGNITHSHPFSNQEHSHSNNILQGINSITTFLFILCGIIKGINLLSCHLLNYKQLIVAKLTLGQHINLRLRAPPVLK